MSSFENIYFKKGLIFYFFRARICNNKGYDKDSSILCRLQREEKWWNFLTEFYVNTTFEPCSGNKLCRISALKIN